MRIPYCLPRARKQGVLPGSYLFCLPFLDGIVSLTDFDVSNTAPMGDVMFFSQQELLNRINILFSLIVASTVLDSSDRTLSDALTIKARGDSEEVDPLLH
jgi:hypothetical protein